EDGALVDVVHPGERLDQGGLAGSVLSHEGVDLAGEEPEAHPVQRLDAGEGDRDVLHLDEGWCGHRVPLRAFSGRRGPVWWGRCGVGRVTPTACGWRCGAGIVRSTVRRRMPPTGRAAPRPGPGAEDRRASAAGPASPGPRW